MANRDFRNREQKKQKKDPKKVTTASILPTEPVAEVEVVKRKRKPQETEEE